MERDDKLLELEQTIASLKAENEKLKQEVAEFRRKEQSISSAIISSMEHANQLEASRRKLYLLDIQRTRLLYLRMEQIINELYRRYPELKNNPKLKDTADRFKTMVFNDLNDKNKDSASFDIKKTFVNDPIKKLLHNIIDCFDSKKVEEVASKSDIPTSSSGFDFNEALNPTMSLDEIMKSFNLSSKPTSAPTDQNNN